MRLPVGAAFGLFALGCAVGRIAHGLEQRERPGLIRPRAAYVGVRPVQVGMQVGLQVGLQGGPQAGLQGGPAVVPGRAYRAGKRVAQRGAPSLVRR